MDLVIDRGTWFRGEGAETSALLTKDGMKCCLGFYCLALAIEPKLIFKVGTPAALPGASVFGLPSEASWLIDRNMGSVDNSADCCSLMEANDSPDLSGEQRELQVTKVFANHNVNVTFID